MKKDNQLQRSGVGLSQDKPQLVQGSLLWSLIHASVNCLNGQNYVNYRAIQKQKKMYTVTLLVLEPLNGI